MAAPFLATQASDGGCSGVGLPSKSPPCCHSEPPERRCPASIQKRGAAPTSALHSCKHEFRERNAGLLPKVFAAVWELVGPFSQKKAVSCGVW